MNRIQFVIPSLGVGGAQSMLIKLLSHIDRNTFEPEVVSLLDEIPLAEAIPDIPVHVLGMRKGTPDPRKLFSLARLLRSKRPDLVQTWMYHADLIGGLAGKIAHVPVLWNIRHGIPEEHDKKLTIGTARICGRLSRIVPQRIVCCADSAMRVHMSIGYEGSRMQVIPNGFDVKKFKPDNVDRMRIREELSIPQEAVVIGMVGRFHPVKDHRTFMEAARLLNVSSSSTYFVAVGEGVDWDNQILREQINLWRGKRMFRLLGRRKDIPQINAAFDIAVSSSCGEAFSNTIGEAMACGVPCAVTDVGDSAKIVADTGRVVPPGNPGAMATAWRELINLGAEKRCALGLRARERVLETYSLDAVAKQYESLFLEVISENISRRKERSVPWGAY